MAKHKLQQFAEIQQFSNVVHQVQRSATIEAHALKGNWKNTFFKNNFPIILELGCGKGEYTIGLGSNHKTKNFIGVDLKGNRIWRGAKTALEKGMENIGFLRTRIENIESCFAPGEVDEIWITFPDPQPQKTRIRKRLTSPNFLKKYLGILKADGIIHLKTDSALLYQYTLEVIEEYGFPVQVKSSDLYKELHSGKSNVEVNYPPETFAIQTFYEKKFSDLGHKICYVRFQLKPFELN